MSNAKRGVVSSVHIVITTLLGMIVTGVCCYIFYVFRTSSAREQSFTDAMKIIQAVSQIVSSVAERDLPGVRGRLDGLESRGRIIEQHQRKTSSLVERLAAGDGVTMAPAQPTDTVASEAAMLAARRAARAGATTSSL